MCCVWGLICISWRKSKHVWCLVWRDLACMAGFSKRWRRSLDFFCLKIISGSCAFKSVIGLCVITLLDFGWYWVWRQAIRWTRSEEEENKKILDSK